MTAFVRGAMILGALILVGCSNLKTSPTSMLSSSSVSQFKTASLAVSCPDGQLGVNGACYPLQRMDISSQGTLTSNNLFTFSGPAATYGFAGLSGSIALDLDSSSTFTEALVEIGYADSCDLGNFHWGSYDELGSHLTNPTYLSAYIIKTNSQGHTELPIDYLLKIPVTANGCFFVDFGSDVWARPGGNVNASVTITNNLKMKYIDAGAALGASAVTMNEALGGGGEFCIGDCDINFNATQNSSTVGQTVTQVPQAFKLMSLIGTIANGPFAADGRYSPDLVVGDWTTENKVYLDPQCSQSVPGTNAILSSVPDLPPGATLLLDVQLSGNGPDSMVNKLIHQAVNIDVAANDCIVSLFIANSNAAMDLESQITAVTDLTGGSGTSAAIIKNLGVVASVTTASNAAAASTPIVAAPNATAVSSATLAATVAPAAVQVAAASVAVPLQTYPVYRFFTRNGRHLYSLRPDAFPNANLEGAAFSVYAQQYSGTVGLYLCAQDVQRFLSSDPNCEGSTLVSLLGYLSPTQVAGTSPLYRTDLNGDWLESLDPNEGPAAGYQDRTVLGSVPN